MNENILKELKEAAIQYGRSTALLEVGKMLEEIGNNTSDISEKYFMTKIMNELIKIK